MSIERTAVMDESAVRRALARMAREVVERTDGTVDLAVMGIHRRGVDIAALLREEIERAEGVHVPEGSIEPSESNWRGRFRPPGSKEHGTYSPGSPGTWEASMSP